MNFQPYIFMTFAALVKEIISGNPTCKPRKSIVSTFHQGQTYFPSYVELDRCAGGIKDPNMYRCQPTKSKENSIVVEDYTGKTHTIVLESHLACEEVCVCGPCQRGKQVPICESGFRWNESSCKCVCNCQGNNVKSTAKASGEDAITPAQLAFIMIAEFVIIALVTVIVIKLYQKWRRNNISHLANPLIPESTSVSYNTLSTN